MSASSSPSNASTDSDAVLIRRFIAAADDGAGEELVRRHATSVYRTLFHLNGNAEDCEDLSQQVFAKAFAALPTYVEQGSFRSWLLRIARNESFALTRQRKVRPGSDRELREDDLNVPSVIQQVESRDRMARIVRAIQQLPEKERIVVQLRLREEISFREIAEVLEVPLGTVLGRMHQARDRLRRAIDLETQIPAS